jgi:hypothetical protein
MSTRRLRRAVPSAAVIPPRGGAADAAASTGLGRLGALVAKDTSIPEATCQPDVSSAWQVALH